MKNIEQPILKILAEYTNENLAIHSITLPFEEIGIDSLSLVEIIFDLEEHFDIAIPGESEIAARGFSLRCLADVYQLVNTLIAEKE